MMQKRLETLLQRIERACERVGRDPNSVKILAVSKGHEASQIKAAHELGLRDFGENYAIEMAQKRASSELSDLDLNWHYIGKIQTNKIKEISHAAWVHTLSEVRHAQSLSTALAQRTINALMQVNLDDKEGRNGVSLDRCLERYQQLREVDNLKMLGLMCVAPLDISKQPQKWFEQMQVLKSQIEQKIGEKIPELSMGMSGDFEDAIAFGATWIRVGTLIFGDR